MEFDVTHEYRRTIADRIDALDELFGALDVPFVIVGPSAMIFFYSHGAAQLLDLSMDDIGRPLFVAAPEETAAVASQAIALAVSTRTSANDVVTLQDDRRYIQQARPIFDETDNHKGTLVTFLSMGSGIQADRRVDHLVEACRYVLSAAQILIMRFNAELTIVYKNFKSPVLDRDTEMRLGRRVSEIIQSGEGVDLVDQDIAWNLIPEPDAYGRTVSVLVVGTARTANPVV
ncbi:MAG: PAS domain-containing protein [Alkalispirochaeta sp.]